MVFSQFGDIEDCEIVRDWKTGDSLQYGFITFKESRACEEAYFKMQNVLIDNHRIHVDFSQSTSRKGRKKPHRRDDRHKRIKKVNHN